MSFAGLGFPSDAPSWGTLLQDAASVRALEFLTSLAVVHKVAPRPNAFRAVSGNETRLFYSGRLALLPSGHWLIPNIKAQLVRGPVRRGGARGDRGSGRAPHAPLAGGRSR